MAVYVACGLPDILTAAPPLPCDFATSIRPSNRQSSSTKCSRRSVGRSVWIKSGKCTLHRPPRHASGCKHLVATLRRLHFVGYTSSVTLRRLSLPGKSRQSSFHYDPIGFLKRPPPSLSRGSQWSMATWRHPRTRARRAREMERMAPFALFGPKCGRCVAGSLQPFAPPRQARGWREFCKPMLRGQWRTLGNPPAVAWSAKEGGGSAGICNWESAIAIGDSNFRILRPIWPPRNCAASIRLRALAHVCPAAVLSLCTHVKEKRQAPDPIERKR